MLLYVVILNFAAGSSDLSFIRHWWNLLPIWEFKLLIFASSLEFMLRKDSGCIPLVSRLLKSGVSRRAAGFLLVPDLDWK